MRERECIILDKFSDKCKAEEQGIILRDSCNIPSSSVLQTAFIQRHSSGDLHNILSSVLLDGFHLCFS